MLILGTRDDSGFVVEVGMNQFMNRYDEILYIHNYKLIQCVSGMRDNDDHLYHGDPRLSSRIPADGRLMPF